MLSFMAGPKICESPRIQEPDFFGAINVKTGRSILFIPRLHPDYAIWDGVIHTTQHFKDKYEVDEVHYSDEVMKTLKTYGCEKLLVLYGLNTDSGRYTKPAQFEVIHIFLKPMFTPVCSHCATYVHTSNTNAILGSYERQQIPPQLTPT